MRGSWGHLGIGPKRETVAAIRAIRPPRTPSLFYRLKEFAGRQLRGAERLVARPMRCLPGFRGGAPAAGADYWAIRRVPRDAGLGLEDLSLAARVRTRSRDKR